MISHKGQDVANLYMNIPEELRLLPNWVLWRFEPGKRKPTKVPYHPNRYKASPIEPKDWVTFEVAFNQFQLGGYDGLGFVFTNTEYSGIDLDDPSFLEDGVTPNPNYQADLDAQIKISKEFDSYSEVSPSGKGLHIFVKGKVPSGTNNRKANVEIYPSGRYFTMTGNVHNNKPVSEYNELLNSLWVQIGGKTEQSIIESGPETSTDDEIIALAFKHNTETFTRLFNADLSGYPSQSEADQAFANILAYYTNSKAQVERIFRNSKLMRPKVNTNKKYLSTTINKAFDQKIPNIDIASLRDALELKLLVNDKVMAISNIEATNHDLPPGLMGELASFIYQAAPRPVPEVALAAAIGLMAGMCGRAYNISGTGLNQYVLLLAMTGAGKEAAASGINKLMNTIKFQVPTSQYFIGPSEISSGAALFKYLGHTSQSFISLLGEFGLRLQQMSSPNANGSEVSLRRMFLDLYNKSGHSEVLHASVYSDKANNTSAVSSPSFSILGESTPERFYGALNEDMISEGLLPRFLLIEYKGNRPALNEHHVNVIPSNKLIERLAELVAQCERINNSNPRRVINVQSTPEAAKMLYDFDKYADSKINSSNKEVIRQLWNRAHIKVLKLSALIAVGENMLEPTIQVNHMEWAAKLVQADIGALTERFEAGEIGNNSFEIKQINEITRVVKEYAEKDFSYVQKYKAVELLHKDKIVSNTYLSLRLDKMAAFKNDRLGSGVALKRAVQLMIDNGKLIEVKGKDLLKYKTTAKCYFISPSILD